MYFIAGLIFFFLCIVAHELGHAFAMRKNNLSLESISFGIKLPKIPSLAVWKSKKYFPGAKIEINHIPLFAYVMPKLQALEKMEKLPYNQAAMVYGAGILNNIFFFLIMTMASALTEDINQGALDWGFQLIIFCLIALLWIFRRFFCKYLIPFFGMIMLVLIVYLIYKDPSGSVGGPITIGKIIAEKSINLSSLFQITAIISLSVAIFNMLPISPLDGGKIISARLRTISSKLNTYYEYAGYIMTALLVGLALGNDLIIVLKKIIGLIKFQALYF